MGKGMQRGPKDLEQGTVQLMVDTYIQVTEGELVYFICLANVCWCW